MTWRNALLAAIAIALIGVPVAMGFTFARAGEVTFQSGTQDPVVIEGDWELPEVIDSTGDQEPMSIEDALTRRPDELTESRITWLRADGRTFPVANGGSVSLDGGFEVAVTVTPYPPVDFDETDVGFAVTRNGSPVEGATISLTYDMRFMAHGPFAADAVPAADGGFSFACRPFMFGPWQLDAVIAAPGSDPIPFSISVYVWPES